MDKQIDFQKDKRPGQLTGRNQTKAGEILTTMLFMPSLNHKFNLVQIKFAKKQKGKQAKLIFCTNYWNYSLKRKLENA